MEKSIFDGPVKISSALLRLNFLIAARLASGASYETIRIAKC
jgi:hypothetical protein